MAYSFTEKKRIRKSFAKRDTVLPVPFHSFRLRHFRGCRHWPGLAPLPAASGPVFWILVDLHAVDLGAFRRCGRDTAMARLQERRVQQQFFLERHLCGA